jgi:hypothetical protein
LGFHFLRKSVLKQASLLSQRERRSIRKRRTEVGVRALQQGGSLSRTLFGNKFRRAPQLFLAK